MRLKAAIPPAANAEPSSTTIHTTARPGARPPVDGKIAVGVGFALGVGNDVADAEAVGLGGTDSAEFTRA